LGARGSFPGPIGVSHPAAVPPWPEQGKRDAIH
jgi:hypothetical protein